MSYDSNKKVDVYGILQEHLHTSEVIKIASRCKSVQRQDADTVLAVISNVHNDHDAEQAALIAVEVPAGQPLGFITGICPIYSDFTFSIEQYDDPKASVGSLEAAGKPMQATFSIVFSASGGSITLKVITDDIAGLGDLLQETKRLTDIAEKHGYTVGSNIASHSWLRAYSVTSADGRKRSFSIPAPKRADTFSSFLSSYGSKALEGLPPSVSSTLGSFGFLSGVGTANISNSGASPRLPTRRPKVHGLFDSQVDEKTKSILNDRKAEYTAEKTIKVHVASFNANGQFYDIKENLAPWLQPDEQPDILVVGLQEMDLRPEVLMVRHDPTIGHAWVAGILACMNESTRKNGGKGYRCIEMKQLAGMYIACFADSVLVKSDIIKHVSSTSVMTGWAGFAGNKGACGIRLTVYDRSLCFVSAHLAAFQENIDRRNADYRDICNRMIFPPTRQNESGHHIPDDQGTLHYPTIFDSDVLFFFGDLNYRLDLGMDQIKTYLETTAYEKLLEHDQLKHAQGSKGGEAAFEDFQEATITFPPTYKYDKGTDSFDSSEKERKPAWTDRILWHIPSEVDDVKLDPRYYGSDMTIKMSDHKAVLAVFDVVLSIIDKSKHDITAEQNSQ